jgi:anti-sigma-K factor RskA
VLRDDELELAAGYALGTLDETDRRLVETLLEGGHAELERAIADFSEASALLAHSAPAALPSAELRTRVLAAARADRPAPDAAADDEAPARALSLESPRKPWIESWGWGFATAAALLAIVAGVTWTGQQRMRQDLARMRDEVAQLRRQLGSEKRWADVLGSPAAKVVQLGATPDGNPSLVARATYDPTSGRAVLVFENFRPPSGHDYELWALRPTGAQSLGLIRTDANGRATLRLEDVGDASSLAAFAVSLEPEGGSPKPDAPTGPVVMAGKVGG